MSFAGGASNYIREREAATPLADMDPWGCKSARTADPGPLRNGSGGDGSEMMIGGVTGLQGRMGLFSLRKRGWGVYPGHYSRSLSTRHWLLLSTSGRAFKRSPDKTTG